MMVNNSLLLKETIYIINIITIYYIKFLASKRKTSSFSTSASNVIETFKI